MNWEILFKRQPITLALPDQISDNQVFTVTIDHKRFRCRFLKQQHILIITDDHGLETTYRLRNSLLLTSARDDQYRIHYESSTSQQKTSLATATLAIAAPGQSSRIMTQKRRALNVCSPLTGKVIKILVERDQEVSSSTPLAIVEAMKMENKIFPEHGGKVTAIKIKEGQQVTVGHELFCVE